jgi:opacity protein-like surface antigen
MKRPTHLLSIMLLFALVAIPVTARGFTVSGVGAKVGYASPQDLSSTAMVGGHVELEQGGTRIHLMPNVMYWKTNDVSNVNPNLDLYYHFRPEGTVTPYLGAGVGLDVNHFDNTDHTDTNFAANVMGGVRIPGGGNHYFIEGRLKASDVSQVAVMGGMTFHTW